MFNVARVIASVHITLSLPRGEQKQHDPNRSEILATDYKEAQRVRFVVGLLIRD
jgi:hypothetical protein